MIIDFFVVLLGTMFSETIMNIDISKYVFMIILTIVSSALISFGMSILVLPSVISFLIYKKIGDRLDSRRMHVVFTPTAGGLGVLIPFFLTVFLFSVPVFSFELLSICSCVILVFLTGLFDDLYNLSAKFKLFIIGFLAIIIMISTGLRIDSFYGLFGIGALPNVFNYILTVLVIVFLTNAFNLIDGIDGLLSTISSFILMVFGVWFFLIGEQTYALIALALLGAIAGFLMFNWFPAKIFMGDTGSLSIGFTIAILSIAFLKTNQGLAIDHFYKISSPVALIISLLVFPIFDTFRVFILRIINKSSPFLADKRHIHHYLFSLKLGPRKVVALLLSFDVILFFTILFFNRFSDTLLVTSLIVFLLISSFGMHLFKVSYFDMIAIPAIQELELEVN
jgi:UDP-GlcNAc:undecaprenyl-phosphate/decaprenyl-phosphate GlcNAc-1-phosphate transferase